MPGKPRNGREGEGDADLSRELHDHLDLEAEDARDRGLSEEEARRAARIDFGSLTIVRETVYNMRPSAMPGRWLRDARQALRALGRSPAFTVVTVALLALGIAASAAIFTVVDRTLLSLLPVQDAAGLVLLEWHGEFIGGTMRGGQDTFSYPAYRDLEAATPAEFDGIAARRQEIVALRTPAGVERATAELVSGNYFEILGVGASLGRTLMEADDREPDGAPFAVLSDSAWRRLFGADPTILNRVVYLNGRSLTVIGVTQPGFAGLEALNPSDLFVPLAQKTVATPTWDDRRRRDSIWLKVFARVQPGVDRRAAETALGPPYAATLRADLAAHGRSVAFRERYLQNRLTLGDASHGLRQSRDAIARPLYLLFGMVGLLLLIVCVNVATLVSERAARRQRELAIRASLGASRWSLIRLTLTESAGIAAAGGAVGFLLSGSIAALVVRALPDERFARGLSVAPDWRVLAFTIGVSAATAILFGVWPAIQGSRLDTAPILGRETTGSANPRHTRVRRILVGAEVALSFVLLVSAGLFVRSFGYLLAVDPGMTTGRVLSFSIDPSQAGYTPARAERLLADLQNRLTAVPGVAAVSAASFPLLAGEGWENTVSVEGHAPADGEDMQAGWNQILPEFFSTIGTPLLAGREFVDRDAAGAPAVVIVNETFARRFFGAPAQTVGRHLGFGGASIPMIEIVGVVQDLKMNDVADKPVPLTFTPALQSGRLADVTFYVAARENPEVLAGAVQRVVRETDPGLPAFNVKTLRRQVADTHFIELLLARLSSTFAGLAALLAAVGLYGVTAFAVARRTREIGIRMALGAARSTIVRLVVWEVAWLAGAGALAGAPLAYGLARVVESQLFGVRATDVPAAAVALALVGLLPLVAAYQPARRAVRINPTQALRQD